MQKVLIVASVISFIEWFNKENVDFLSKMLNCEVHIAVNTSYMQDTDEERTKRYLEKLKSDGVIIHHVSFPRSPFTFKLFSSYKKLKKIIDSENFDLIHCHTPTVSILTRWAARQTRKLGTVVMYTCHGFHFHKATTKKNWLIYYPIEKILSKFCDYLVTINQEDFSIAKSFYCKNVKYIHGVGVDLEKITKTIINKTEYKKNLSLPENCVLILSIGELIPRKNHEVIIKALGQLKNDNIYYAIAGKGELKEYLEELVKQLNLEKNIIFLGFRTDVAELCHAADISAFPSKIEGLGLAGIEAMAAGVPLISSNVHGILDYVIDGETGYAIPPNDINGYAKAINHLVKSPELRAEMKEKCLNAVRPFALENALNEMKDIYKEILLTEE